jgi:putative RNA 2'-phosphotransferase
MQGTRSSEVRLSKFLSFVLRHKPQTIGIQLDSAGWVGVAELLRACTEHQVTVSRADLDQVVANDEKSRYEFSPDGLLIRASQGHSIAVDLGYEVKEPPEFLYHGTVARFIEAVRAEGLKKGQRHDVHLSADRETACQVGRRRGEPIILRIRSREMHQAGYQFRLSTNGVWLTDHIPLPYIEFP